MKDETEIKPTHTLFSGSFPPEQPPQVTSSVHALITKHLTHSPLPKWSIRPFTAADLDQLRALQNEWFPIQYGRQFYQRILGGVATCYVVEATFQASPESKPQSMIIGAVAFELHREDEHLVESWWKRVLSWQLNSVYIMTLGVVDEYRGKGIASELLRMIADMATNRSSIKMVQLHVVSYNASAIAFYRKNGYELIERIEKHYHILGGEYQGLKLGLFVNGGQKRQSWEQWGKRVILGKTVNEWPDAK